MKRTRYKPGPLTAAAMKEWIEFEERNRGSQTSTPSERDRKLAEALTEAERSIDHASNAIRVPESQESKQFKRARRRPKMLPDDAPMFKARRQKKRD